MTSHTLARDNLFPDLDLQKKRTLDYIFLNPSILSRAFVKICRETQKSFKAQKLQHIKPKVQENDARVMEDLRFNIEILKGDGMATLEYGHFTTSSCELLAHWNSTPVDSGLLL